MRLSLISKEISDKILANVRVFRFRSENDAKGYRLVSTLNKAVLKWSLLIATWQTEYFILKVIIHENKPLFNKQVELV